MPGYTTHVLPVCITGVAVIGRVDLLLSGSTVLTQIAMSSLVVWCV